MTNSASKIKIVPLDEPLGAKVLGVDFSAPVDAETKALLNKAWADHLVLLFPGQDITPAQHVTTTEIFGSPVRGASRKYYEAEGRLPAEAIVEQPEIIVVTNLGQDGEPVEENEGLGSSEVVWHSDNSYIDEPPVGSFLRAVVLPPSGGATSFNNQYMAYDTLPQEVKQRIVGLYTKQDSSRNSAGTLRPGVKKPETLDDVPGPNHPLVRMHPKTNKPALYLGRRRVFPSQSVTGWEQEESEELLDYLWEHATQDAFKWTHTWSEGDMVLWDNCCTMHYREKISSQHPRIMHRTQMDRQKPIPA